MSTDRSSPLSDAPPSIASEWFILMRMLASKCPGLSTDMRIMSTVRVAPGGRIQGDRGNVRRPRDDRPAARSPIQSDAALVSLIPVDARSTGFETIEGSSAAVALSRGSSPRYSASVGSARWMNGSAETASTMRSGVACGLCTSNRHTYGTPVGSRTPISGCT